MITTREARLAAEAWLREEAGRHPELVGAILVLVGRNRAKHVQGPERSIAALEATKSTLRG